MLADMFGENTNGQKIGRPVTINSIETDFRDYFAGTSRVSAASS